MEPHHHIAIRELDLSRACGPSSVAERINAVPALKTSAAFFTFLRANLALNPSALSSQTNTPLLEPAYTCAPPPSPSLSTVHSVTTADDDIPPLSLEILRDEHDRTDALQLVADSVAQQRGLAAASLVRHPLAISGLAGSLALAYQCSRLSGRDGLGAALMVCCAVAAGYLLAVHYLTVEYHRLAEDVIPSWSSSKEHARETIIGARLGGEIVGALVLRLEPNPNQLGRRRGRYPSLRGGKGVIRAWTTGAKHRGQGVGRDLLLRAARLTREKCGKDAAVGFAKEHANSAMVLPEMFNSPFRSSERRAAKALEEVLASLDVGRKKR